MFDRLKNVFARKGPGESPQEATESTSSQLSEWAGTQGFGLSIKPGGKGFGLDGQVQDRPWRLECGKPSRDFIRGEELRVRAELGVREYAAILVMNRPLKDALEKRAYALYTDSLQTTVDPRLPEEMRWLAMYEEVGWESAPPEFWNWYSVLAENKDDAVALIDDDLARELLGWPLANPQVPVILMMLRGKAYLRMEGSQHDMATMDHALRVFQLFCNRALQTLQPGPAD